MSELVVLPCGDLRVMFEWRADRFGHRIEVRDGERFVPACASCEGAAADAWPPSPGLQSVHLEQRALGGVALLVGMAGTSHWSMSVEANSASGSATFSVAARIRSKPDWLGSTYAWHSRLLGDLRPPVRFDARGMLIEMVSPNVVLRADLGDGPLPRTISWRYTIASGQADGR